MNKKINFMNFRKYCFKLRLNLRGNDEDLRENFILEVWDEVKYLFRENMIIKLVENCN